MKEKNVASEYPLDECDVRKIINATKTIRNKLIIELLAYTGCRRGELVLLRFRDLNLEIGQINMPTLKQHKGEKDRTEVAYRNFRRIPIINEDLRRDLASYIELIKAKRHVSPSYRLFQTRQSISMRSETVNFIVAKAAKAAGVESPNPSRKQVHPHMFRHTFVRYAQRYGLGTKTIQMIAGHASIATTLDMYGHPTWADKKDEMRKMKDFGVS